MDVFALDSAALLLPTPRPAVLIKTGPSWLYLVNVDTMSAQRVDESVLGVQGYNVAMDGDVAWDGRLGRLRFGRDGYRRGGHERIP